MRILIIIIATVFAVWQILIHFGVFELSRGSSGLREDIAKRDKSINKRQLEINKLAIYTSVTNAFRGIFMSDNTYERYEFYISRLEIKSKVLDRHLKPEELKGKYALRLIVGLLCIPLGVLWKPFLLVTVYGVISYFAQPVILDSKIQEEDKIIDVYFIDLFLLLYAQLRQGSQARLANVVEAYINTLTVAPNERMRETMTKLAKFLLNNLTMYPDHMAVPKLREVYHSATIVNFCNVATQALQGIDNGESLLSLKLELVRKKSELMKINSEKMREKGNMAVMLIWIVLFIFIAVGWYSKLPVSTLKSFL